MKQIEWCVITRSSSISTFQVVFLHSFGLKMCPASFSHLMWSEAEKLGIEWKFKHVYWSILSKNIIFKVIITPQIMGVFQKFFCVNFSVGSTSVPDFIEMLNTWCIPFAHLAWNDPLMRILKRQTFQVSQYNDRVLTCWITKGWQKTNWVKFSASPVASTNQFFKTLASGWFWQFSQKKTADFGCLTNALAPPPIALESCSTAQTDWPD